MENPSTSRLVLLQVHWKGGMMKETTAISGSHGFLGEALTKKLEQSGQEVLRLDRSGIISADIGLVFDLAAYGNMADQTDVREIYRANLMRVINMVEEGCFERLIYISTSSVSLPNQTPYSLSKKAAEEYLQWSREKVAIARPLTPVGVGEQKEHLIPKLIQSCLYGIEIPFVADPVHDFIDIDDFVDALLTIKDKGLFEGEIYEIGSGKQVSNDEVRLLVEETTGKRANVRPVESMRSYDTKEWRANNERICSLGWEPRISLKTTIQRMIDNERTT